MDKYIEKAKEAQEDETPFLQKKETLESKAIELERKYEEILTKELKMRQTHDALLAQIEDLKARKEAIDIKLEKVKLQNKINDINSGSFASLEEKVNRALDEAEAVAELNEFERENIFKGKGKWVFFEENYLM